MPVHKKKRLFEMGKQASMTKLGPKKVITVKGRGANMKYRALKIDHGTFSWGSENISRKTRVLDVVYNATNNELVRTKTLVKNTVVTIDATPFRNWYLQHYGIELGKKKEKKGEEKKDAAAEPAKKSKHTLGKQKKRCANRVIDQHVVDNFNSGRLLACISSRPGQSGRLDGYLLEGQELQFYVKKMDRKKK